jgi:hypothetical protein
MQNVQRTPWTQSGSFFFNSHSGGLSPSWVHSATSATEWPIVPAPGDYDDGEFGGMKIGRGNRSTRKKPAPVPLCPSQIPLDQTRSRTRLAAVGSQRLNASAMARPNLGVTRMHGFYILLIEECPP